MTLAAFKKKVTIDAKIAVQLYWYNKETKAPYLQADFGTRAIGLVQSNRYAFNTVKPEGVKLSYADWPKASEIEELPDGKVKVLFSFGYFIYDFNPAQ